MTVFHAIKMLFSPIAIVYSMRYNSPSVMIASIIFFLWVRTWKVQSKKINWISVSVLSVYIVHSQPIVAEFFFGYLKEIVSVYPAPIAGIMVIAAMLVLYVCCILLDKIRIALINPFADKIADGLKNKSMRFFENLCG